MSDKITTLHPVGDPNTDVYPNIKNENFPNNVNFSNTKVPLTTASKNYFMLLDDNGNAYKSLYSITLSNFNVIRSNINNTFSGVNTFNNTTYLNGNTFFEETATFKDVVFDGEIDFNGTVNFNEDFTFSVEVTFGGKTYVNDTMTISDSGSFVNYGSTNLRGSLSLGSDAKSSLIDLIYPVGSIYISANNVNPTTLFGGTWQQLKDRFLLGSGDTYNVGNTGGEATHTLTQYELPSHKHAIQLSNSSGGSSSGDYLSISGTGNGTLATHTLTRWMNYTKDLIDINGNEYINANQPHNNMPPYLVVSIWKRTA